MFAWEYLSFSCSVSHTSTVLTIIDFKLKTTFSLTVFKGAVPPKTHKAILREHHTVATCRVLLQSLASTRSVESICCANQPVEDHCASSQVCLQTGEGFYYLLFLGFEVERSNCLPFGRIFSKHLKPNNIFRENLVNPEGKTPINMLSSADVTLYSSDQTRNVSRSVLFQV